MTSDASVDQALAQTLKEVREECDLTQEQLAAKAGLTASALSRIERGLNSPGWFTVRSLARALDVTMVDLSSWVEEVG